jgi:hypothetical protein
MSKPTHIDKCDCDLCRAYLIETQRVDTPMPKIKFSKIEKDIERNGYLTGHKAVYLIDVVREMREALKETYSCVLSSNACEDCNLTAKQALDLVEEE